MLRLNFAFPFIYTYTYLQISVVTWVLCKRKKWKLRSKLKTSKTSEKEICAFRVRRNFLLYTYFTKVYTVTRKLWHTLVQARNKSYKG